MFVEWTLSEYSSRDSQSEHVMACDLRTLCRALLPHISRISHNGNSVNVVIDASLIVV